MVQTTPPPFKTFTSIRGKTVKVRPEHVAGIIEADGDGTEIILSGGNVVEVQDPIDRVEDEISSG